MESIKKQKKAQQPVLETQVVTLVAVHERPVRKADGHAQPKPKERSQDAEDTDCAAAVFDQFVEIGFKHKKVADDGNCQVCHESGRGENEGVCRLRRKETGSGD
jgi:hypothetical protein